MVAYKIVQHPFEQWIFIVDMSPFYFRGVLLAPSHTVISVDNPVHFNIHL